MNDLFSNETLTDIDYFLLTRRAPIYQHNFKGITIRDRKKAEIYDIPLYVRHSLGYSVLPFKIYEAEKCATLMQYYSNKKDVLECYVL